MNIVLWESIQRDQIGILRQSLMTLMMTLQIAIVVVDLRNIENSVNLILDHLEKMIVNPKQTIRRRTGPLNPEDMVVILSLIRTLKIRTK